MPTAVVGVGDLPPFVCLSVIPHDISKTDAARISKLNMCFDMFHDESWKPIYFGIKVVSYKKHKQSRRSAAGWFYPSVRPST